jgi:hypothetical protein
VADLHWPGRRQHNRAGTAGARLLGAGPSDRDLSCWSGRSRWGPLGRLDPYGTPDLLALASPAALKQLAELRCVLEQALLPRLATRHGTCALGPTFTGSALINADAELVAAGLLLEVKTSQGPKRPDGTRRAALDKVDLFQLIGYALLDFDDAYQITELGIFAARFAYSVHLARTALLSEMAGDVLDLSSIRDAFRQLLMDGWRGVGA